MFSPCHNMPEPAGKTTRTRAIAASARSPPLHHAALHTPEPLWPASSACDCIDCGRDADASAAIKWAVPCRDCPPEAPQAVQDASAHATLHDAPHNESSNCSIVHHSASDLLTGIAASQVCECPNCEEDARAAADPVSARQPNACCDAARVDASSNIPTLAAAPVEVLDIAIIGGGPHALALVCRLCEDQLDVQTEAEKARAAFWKRRLQAGAMRSGISKSGKVIPERTETSATRALPCVRVFDPSGRFMTNWKAMFAAMRIAHLRSPSFVHPDPFDSDALRGFAMASGRLDEHHLRPIPILFESVSTRKPRPGGGTRGAREHGTSRSKACNLGLNHVSREQFSLPSTELFEDFCDSLVDRYRVADLVIAAKVLDVTLMQYPKADGTLRNVFQMNLSTGDIAYAHAVVFCVGAGTMPRLPSWLSSVTCRIGDDVKHGVDAVKRVDTSALLHTCQLGTIIPHVDNPGAAAAMHMTGCERTPPAHAMPAISRDPEEIHHAFLQRRRTDSSMHELMAGKRIIVVGGGISCVHLALAAVQWDAASVTFVHRSELKARQFDLDVSWFSRIRGHHLAHFWSLSHQERLSHIRAIRGGGTVPTELLERLFAAVRGVDRRVVLRMDEIASAAFANNAWELTMRSGETLAADCVLLATGMQADFLREPVTSKLAQQLSVRTHGGLPVLTTDLRCASGVDAFVMGAFAALELGPDALNIAGGVAAARRLQDVLVSLMQAQANSPSAACSLPDDVLKARRLRSCVTRLTGGDGNLFAVLGDDSDSDSD